MASQSSSFLLLACLPGLPCALCSEVRMAEAEEVQCIPRTVCTRRRRIEQPYQRSLSQPTPPPPLSPPPPLLSLAKWLASSGLLRTRIRIHATMLGRLASRREIGLCSFVHQPDQLLSLLCLPLHSTIQIVIGSRTVIVSNYWKCIGRGS